MSCLVFRNYFRLVLRLILSGYLESVLQAAQAHHSLLLYHKPHQTSSSIRSSHVYLWHWNLNMSKFSIAIGWSAFKGRGLPIGPLDMKKYSFLLRFVMQTSQCCELCTVEVKQIERWACGQIFVLSVVSKGWTNSSGLKAASTLDPYFFLCHSGWFGTHSNSSVKLLSCHKLKVLRDLGIVKIEIPSMQQILMFC